MSTTSSKWSFHIFTKKAKVDSPSDYYGTLGLSQHPDSPQSYSSTLSSTATYTECEYRFSEEILNWSHSNYTLDVDGKTDYSTGIGPGSEPGEYLSRKPSKSSSLRSLFQKCQWSKLKSKQNNLLSSTSPTQLPTGWHDYFVIPIKSPNLPPVESTSIQSTYLTSMRKLRCSHRPLIQIVLIQHMILRIRTGIDNPTTPKKHSTSPYRQSSSPLIKLSPRPCPTSLPLSPRYSIYCAQAARASEDDDIPIAFLRTSPP